MHPAAVCTASAQCSPWRVVDTWDGVSPVVALTSFQPTDQPSTVTAYAAWIRADKVDVALYPGYKGPGPSTLDRGPESVPSSATVRLLATFNSGFYESDDPAGFFTHDTLFDPMVKGEATLVRYATGRVDIVDWTGPARPGADVLMARQNLSLLVDDGHATAASTDWSQWGLTLHGVAAVWRTALGVDAHGNLLYVAAPAQTPASLAAIMVQLHAVRAMQLDINPEWPIFVTYGARGAAQPSLDVPNPNQIATRFLYSSTKDFFAVFASRQPGEAQPW